MDNKVKFITRTAVLLALTILFQMLRPVLAPLMGTGNIFVIGTLVNASLLVAAAMVGIQGGVIISVIAPIVAFYQGQLPLVVVIPVIVIGNSVLVITFYLLKNKNAIAAVLAAALCKFLVQFFGLRLLLGMFSADKQAATKLGNMLNFGFSWPQLVTAVLGGLVALAVIKVLRKSTQN